MTGILLSPPQLFAIARFAVLTLAAMTCLPCVAEPVIGGLANTRPDAALRGTILIEEMNCVACHSAPSTLAARSKAAPRLAEVASRLHPDYIESFIRSPHTVKPGTTMPDLLAPLPAAERDEVAKAITHYLLSLHPTPFAPAVHDPVAAAAGNRLFHSRGCAACHSPRDDAARETGMEGSVPLGALEHRYSISSLTAFLRHPHKVRPSGRMPDLRLKDNEADLISHYLLQQVRIPGALRYTLYRGLVWEGIDSENVTAEKGGQVDGFDLTLLERVPHNSAVVFEGWLHIDEPGPHEFHLAMNGGKLTVAGKDLITEAPSERKEPGEFHASIDLPGGIHPIRLEYYQTGREPRFAFEMQAPGKPRGPIPAAMLSVEKERASAYVPPVIDPDLAAKGREHFTSIGCANCHDDLDLAPKEFPPFASLKADQGCLDGDSNSPSPRFGFSEEQRAAIRTALPKAAEPGFDDATQIHKTLTSLNCIACHQRDGLGGPSQGRLDLFTSTQPALGDQGRIPPTLTGVGAKLTKEWMTQVLLHGGRQRDYVEASMPQYGEAQVEHLISLFDRVDQLEEAKLPEVGPILESKAAGYELVGARGLACIACHQFNGQSGGDLAALDIAHVPQRLKRNWFDLYMRQPSRFHSTTIMPGFWPDGKSVRPNILEGDSAQQIEAIWNYLSDGERARKPEGLSRETNVLRVGDVAEICRGRSPSTGFRGIGVGYPERINLAFDAGEMTLRQLWHGNFATVDFGAFKPNGAEPITLPPGIPFHRLSSPEENWPYKGKSNHAFPADLGYQWLGYTLDEKRRPLFRYRYGQITITDFFEDVTDGNKSAYFRRTLVFDAPSAQESFSFRAAAGDSVKKESERSYVIGRLRLVLGPDLTATLRDGTPSEVLIPLTLPAGKTTVTVEYHW
ncbi:MAG: c-type cytochrome [Akkermansiaceae bacterium]|jgi:mono/diheme cytochrome c family protein|nr:c-type cytochrome [Akkermansiaceae bacterium]